ncbi:MAG: c-type cytochrome [Bacteroidota bacterium]
MTILRIKPAYKALFIATGFIVSGLGMTSCDRSRNDKGYEYFPDMAHSLAYETYSPNPNYKDGKTEQAPVAGTVSREMVPYPYPNTPEGRTQAGLELKNPYQINAKTLEQGKNLFTVFCKNCHGDQGNGDGYLFTSGRFPVKPADFHSERVMGLPAGEIYHVITNGYNVMGPHGAQIKPDDRWKVVLYVQHELQKKP